jgi:peroxiredoxin
MSRISSQLLLLLLFMAFLTVPACAGPEKPASAELALGAAGPEFELKGVDGKVRSLGAAKDARAVVLIFTCLSCPYARAYEDRVIDLARDYSKRGVQFMAIMSNDPSIVPADSFDKLKARSEEKKYPFPYLVDEKQEVAKAYGAQVTPHVFVLGADRTLAYRGRIDDSTDVAKVTQSDLRNALDALLAGKEVAAASTKAFGCSIKWKKEKSS